jgi:ribonuclease-3
MTEVEDEALCALEARLGHRFRDRDLLREALRHASYAHETEGAISNERLEFLGDAVIGVVVAQLLFEAQPGWREGELTRALHDLVDRRALARVARELDLGSQLRLGRTERQSEGHEKDSILGDAMEAVLGALYLDAGLDPVRRLAERVFQDALHADAAPVERDPKTRLQEHVMALHGIFPHYELERDSGLEGDERRFTVRVCVGEEQRGVGVGRTKRGAERAAAEAAWQALEAEAAHAED